MKAMFEGNPYKFWNRVTNATLHLFDNDRFADEFANRLKTNFEVSPGHDPANEILVTDNPANGPECASTWAQLVCDWASCCGYESMVLHIGNDDVDLPLDFIHWTLERALNEHTEVNWDWTYGDGMANIHFSKEFNTALKYPEKEKFVCEYLFDLFDNAVCEMYDWDGEYTRVAHDWKEMVGYRELVLA